MLHYVRAISKFGFPFIGEYLLSIRPRTKHNDKLDNTKRYKKVHKMIKRLSKDLKVDFIIEGEENLPKDGLALYTPNHLSFYDPLAFLSFYEKPITFVAKTEISHYPVIGVCVDYLRGYFMDRDDMKGSLKVMNSVQERLESGDQSWFIYPEGTRNVDPLHKLAEFHYGSYRNPMRAKVPIVPVAIYGTFRVLKLRPQYKKYPIYVKYLKPLYPEQYQNMSSKEVAKYCQDEVQKALSFDIRRKDAQYMSSQCKHYKTNLVY